MPFANKKNWISWIYNLNVLWKIAFVEIVTSTNRNEHQPTYQFFTCLQSASSPKDQKFLRISLNFTSTKSSLRKNNSFYCFFSSHNLATKLNRNVVALHLFVLKHKLKCKTTKTKPFVCRHGVIRVLCFFSSSL